MKFNFTAKDSYLKWRQEWREQYAELTADIRQMKRARKQFLRVYERYQTPQGKARRLLAKHANPHHGPTYRLDGLRGAAAYQMELLAEAKALSWQMKQANRKAA
jgi:hypothetical protein